MVKKLYYWMTTPTAQREWIEGQGVFIALAFFLGGVSGGLYLASLFYSSILGMFISWLLSFLMGMCYLVHLGKRLRFWKMFRKPQTSWISRGFIFINLFIGFTAIQLALSLWSPGSNWETLFKGLAGIMAFAQSIYTGFALSYVSAIKLWNSAIVPILFVTCGMLGGLAILLGISLGGNYDRVAALEDIIRVMLVFYAFIIAVYLWNATYGDAIAKTSAMMLIRGSIAPLFWIGVVFLGLVVPIAISALFYFTAEVSEKLLLTAVISEIISGMTLRYVILKAGMYAPLVPAPGMSEI